MDKTKQSPIPDKTTKEVPQKPTEKQTGFKEPGFIRGTIDPTTKKER